MATGRATDQAIRAFGKRLRTVIDERGLTLRETAVRAGITPESLSAYVNGRRGPDFRSLIGIADALSVSPALFFCPSMEWAVKDSECWRPVETKNTDDDRSSEGPDEKELEHVR